MQFVKSGRLTALGLTGDNRLSLLPDVATTKEIGNPSFYIELSQWVGAFVAAGTPPEVTARLNEEINKALVLPEGIEKHSQLGGGPAKMTVTEYTEIYKAKMARIQDVVVRANIPVKN